MELVSTIPIKYKKVFIIKVYMFEQVLNHLFSHVWVSELYRSSLTFAYWGSRSN
jgi:hypothetical protein